MRILQLSSKVPWPPKDGESIAILTLSKGFFLHGHQVTVLAMNTHDRRVDADELPEHLAAEIDFRLVDVPGKITFRRVFRNAFMPDLPLHAERCICNEYREALGSLLCSQSFDVIQLEGLYLCPYIPLIRQYSRALIAYRVHNIDHEIWQHALKQKGIRKLIYL
ncbi:MAG: hypothetical protein AB7D05_09540, partial [Mangrovibacterium sp.]